MGLASALTGDEMRPALGSEVPVKNVETGGVIVVPDINIWAVASGQSCWAVLLANASSMVVGSIWYTPKVFGNYWMRGVTKVTPEADAKSAVRPILVMLVTFVVMALISKAFGASKHTSHVPRSTAALQRRSNRRSVVSRLAETQGRGSRR